MLTDIEARRDGNAREVSELQRKAGARAFMSLCLATKGI